MKSAVILTGCGQYDGSETHETVLTFLSLSQEKITWEAFAPDIYAGVINHLTGHPEPHEKRSVLKESARLARGSVKALSEIKLKEYDMVIFPGGMGSVKNACNWAEQGADFSFQVDIKHLIDEAVKLKKPMGFICIAPMMITKIYKDARFTIGQDSHLAKEIQEAGCHHQVCFASDIVVDETHRLVSTPANMVAQTVDEVYQGILKLVKALKNLSSGAAEV